MSLFISGENIAASLTSIDDPSYLKALSSVFPQVHLIPTGGVKSDDISQYLEYGAMCVGLGGELVSEGLILDGQRETIIQLGKQVLQQTAAF